MLRKLALALLAAAALARSAGAQSSAGPAEKAASPPPLPVAWRADGVGATAPPLVAGDRLYVATAKGAVKTLVLADGRELWSRDFAKGFQAPLALADGVLIAAAPHPTARAYGVDPRTGEELWRRSAGDLAQAPLVQPGRVVLVSQGGQVRALNPASGEPLWEARLEGVFTGGSLVAGGDLVVLSAAGVLYRVRTATGDRLGSLDTGAPAAPGLAALADTSGFLVASFTGRVRGFAFDLTPLAIDFQAAPLFHPPAIGADRVFVPGTDRVLRAYGLPSGALLWERAFDVAFAGPPAVSADGARIAVGDLAGTVWALDAATGEPRSRTPVSEAAVLPLWTGERLVVAGEKGPLVVLAEGGA